MSTSSRSKSSSKGQSARRTSAKNTLNDRLVEHSEQDEDDDDEEEEKGDDDDDDEEEVTVVPKVTIQKLAFKRKKYKSKFLKIKTKEVSFDATPPEQASYYNQDILIDPQFDKINDIASIECTNIIATKGSRQESDIKPKDDPAARVVRVQAFEDAAKKRVFPVADFDDLEDCLMRDETIVATLDCSFISGVPTTTEESVISGSIKVSIVESTSDGYRLLFSVADGWKEVSIFEEFKEMDSVSTCACCLYQVRNDNAQVKSQSSSATLKYSTKRAFNAQFATLPVNQCLVDSFCYRSAVDEFYALTESDAAGGTCSDIASCCLILWDILKGCACTCEKGESSKCCGPSTISDVKTVRFEAKQGKNLNEELEAFIPFNDQPTNEVDGLTWSITASNQDYVYVLIHYRSLLNMSYRTCKLRLSQAKTPVENYKLAKKFVSILCSERSARDNNFFTNQGAMSFGVYSRHMFRGGEKLTAEELAEKKRQEELAAKGEHNHSSCFDSLFKWCPCSKPCCGPVQSCLRYCGKCCHCPTCCTSCC